MLTTLFIYSIKISISNVHEYNLTSKISHGLIDSSVQTNLHAAQYSQHASSFSQILEGTSLQATLQLSSYQPDRHWKKTTTSN